MCVSRSSGEWKGRRGVREPGVNQSRNRQIVILESRDRIRTNAAAILRLTKFEAQSNVKSEELTSARSWRRVRCMAVSVPGIESIAR